MLMDSPASGRKDSPSGPEESDASVRAGVLHEIIVGTFLSRFSVVY